MIIRVNAVLNRTFVDSDGRCDVIFRVKVSCIASVDGIKLSDWFSYLIGQLSRNVIGRVSVKPWCYCL